VTGQFVNTGGNNYYLEIGFLPGAGDLSAGGQTGEIQVRFNKSNWTHYYQPDDYSYEPSFGTFTDHAYITLFENNVLVWGNKP